MIKKHCHITANFCTNRARSIAPVVICSSRKCRFQQEFGQIAEIITSLLLKTPSLANFLLNHLELMENIKLRVNGQQQEVDTDPKMPLLWTLRDILGLTGTKFSCGIAQCGACTVHLDGVPARSCVIPTSAASGKEITTIEGLSADNSNAVQLAWIAEQVPQCGYCQSGQIMSAVALLKKHPDPTDAEIDAAMNSVLCRCGTYPRIRKAIREASKMKL